MTSQETISLIERIAVGDNEAENLLFSQFHNKITLLVNIRLRGRVPAYDLADIISEIHNAVLVSLRNGNFKLELGYSFEAYIAGIAGNIAGQYFRKQKKNIPAKDIDSIKNVQSSSNALSELITIERNEKLKKYLGQLKPKYQEVLLLRIYEERTIEEISNILGIEKRRVSERINYAFKLLLKECKRDEYFQYYDKNDK